MRIVAFVPAWKSLRFAAVFLFGFGPPAFPMFHSMAAIHLLRCGGRCRLRTASTRFVQAAESLLAKRPFILPVFVSGVAIEVGGDQPCSRGSGRSCWTPNTCRTTAVVLRKWWPSALLQPRPAASLSLVRRPGAPHGSQANCASIDAAPLVVLGAAVLRLLRRPVLMVISKALVTIKAGSRRGRLCTCEGRCLRLDCT